MMTASDYLTLYNSCALTEDTGKLKVIDSVCNVALANQALYQLVEKKTKKEFGVCIPWPIIAVIHFREADQNFTKHLHNGDSLTDRTFHIPAGRPHNGFPPFTWVESATDAFIGLWYPYFWDIANCLQFLERYNGTGYQKHGVNSPYLWDFTNHYTSGLFVSDGRFDPDKKESRPGCVAILKTLLTKGVSLDFSALDAAGPALH